MSEPLHIKYRPQSLDDVIGQEAVVASLKKVLTGTIPHAFLFTGPSGVGKTTLARILGKHLGCAEQNLMQIDAATNSGIDNMRNVLSSIQYRGLGESGIRFVIIDECHGLSKATWQSLLLTLEEPPSHVYWALCTTEAEKVPATVKTRCVSYRLNPVKSDTIYELLAAIRDIENLDVPDSILGLVSRQAQGSVRQALVYLATVNGVKDNKEALRLLEQVGEEKTAIDLARLLAKGQGVTWERIRDMLADMSEENPESIRLTIVNYVLKAALAKDTGPQQAARYMSILSAFSQPCGTTDGMSTLLLSVGQLLFVE